MKNLPLPVIILFISINAFCQKSIQGFTDEASNKEFALEEKYDDALNILAEFIKRYPDNENRILVESLVDEIKKIVGDPGDGNIINIQFISFNEK